MQEGLAWARREPSKLGRVEEAQLYLALGALEDNPRARRIRFDLAIAMAQVRRCAYNAGTALRLPLTRLLTGLLTEADPPQRSRLQAPHQSPALPVSNRAGRGPWRPALASAALQAQGQGLSGSEGITPALRDVRSSSACSKSSSRSRIATRHLMQPQPHNQTHNPSQHNAVQRSAHLQPCHAMARCAVPCHAIDWACH